MKRMAFKVGGWVGGWVGEGGEQVQLREGETEWMGGWMDG